jgi:hypothetical protein
LGKIGGDRDKERESQGEKGGDRGMKRKGDTERY